MEKHNIEQLLRERGKRLQSVDLPKLQLEDLNKRIEHRREIRTTLWCVLIVVSSLSLVIAGAILQPFYDLSFMTEPFVGIWNSIKGSLVEIIRSIDIQITIMLFIGMIFLISLDELLRWHFYKRKKE